MKNILIFPPIWRIFSAPYLSLPSLTAYLRQNGLEVKLIDLNIKLINILACSDIARNIATEIYERFYELDKIPLSGYQQLYYTKLFNSMIVMPAIIENIEKAKIVRQSTDFYDYEKYLFYTRILNTFLENIHSLDYFNISNNEKFLTKKFTVDDFLGIINSSYISYFSSELIKKEIQILIKTYNPQLIGISLCTGEQLFYSFLIARFIKEINKDIHVVIGGAFITSENDLIFKYDNFFKIVDSFVVYEGEYALLNLIKQLDKKRNLSKVPNLIYYKKNKIIANQTYSVDFNSMPTPDYTDINWKDYWTPKPVLYLNTSRGCYYGKCSYCIDNYVYLKKCNLREPHKVIEDMIILSRQNNTNLFFFNDEAVPPRNLKRISQILIDEKLDFKWCCEIRFEKILNKEFIKLLSRSGCKKLMFGLESISPRVIKLMNKSIDVLRIPEVLKHCYENGIAVHLFMISGFPTETLDELKQSIEFILQQPLLYGSGVAYTKFQLFRLSKIAFSPEKYGIKINSYEHNYFEQEIKIYEGMNKNRDINIGFMTKNYPEIGPENLLYIVNQKFLTPVELELKTAIQVNIKNIDNSIFLGMKLKVNKNTYRFRFKHNMEHIIKNLNEFYFKYDRGIIRGDNPYSFINTSFPSEKGWYEAAYNLKNSLVLNYEPICSDLFDLLNGSRTVFEIFNIFTAKNKLKSVIGYNLTINTLKNLYFNDFINLE